MNDKESKKLLNALADKRESILLDGFRYAERQDYEKAKTCSYILEGIDIAVHEVEKSIRD